MVSHCLETSATIPGIWDIVEPITIAPRKLSQIRYYTRTATAAAR